MQNCRFHYAYYTLHLEDLYDPNPDPDQEDQEEMDLECDEYEGNISSRVERGFFTPQEGTSHSVELVKAPDMVYTNSQTYCKDCEPLFVNSPGSREWCRCIMYSHFVKPWRCIPCVLAEETRQIASQQKYTVTYDPKAVWREWMYKRVKTAPFAPNVNDFANQ